MSLYEYAKIVFAPENAHKTGREIGQLLVQAGLRLPSEPDEPDDPHNSAELLTSDEMRTK